MRLALIIAALSLILISQTGEGQFWLRLMMGGNG
jgi:hypothetical protein